MAIPFESRADVHAQLLLFGTLHELNLCHRQFDFLLQHEWRCLHYSYFDKTQEEINHWVKSKENNANEKSY